MAYQASAEQRIKKRFSSTRYILSKAGIPKILAILLFLVAGILFLTASGSRVSCAGQDGSTNLPPNWYAWLFPLASVSSAALSSVTYGVFATGCATRALGAWVNVDITTSILLAIVNLIISILSITQCPPANAIDLVPEPLGLVATALLIICAAATYFMWRYRRDEEVARASSGQSAATTSTNQQVRGSIFTYEVEKGAFGV